MNSTKPGKSWPTQYCRAGPPRDEARMRLRAQWIAVSATPVSGTDIFCVVRKQQCSTTAWLILRDAGSDVNTTVTASRLFLVLLSATVPARDLTNKEAVHQFQPDYHHAQAWSSHSPHVINVLQGRRQEPVDRALQKIASGPYRF